MMGWVDAHNSLVGQNKCDKAQISTWSVAGKGKAKGEAKELVTVSTTNLVLT